MTSWIILLIKQYIDIAKYLLIGDAIFDLNNDKKKRIKENIILSSIILVIYIIFIVNRGYMDRFKCTDMFNLSNYYL